MSNVPFPDVLFSSSDFGPDFDPDYTEWDKVTGKTDLYSTVDVITQDGKTTITTLTAQATWSEPNGSFKLREVDDDLEDDQEVDDDLSAYTNSLLSFT